MRYFYLFKCHQFSLTFLKHKFIIGVLALNNKVFQNLCECIYIRAFLIIFQIVSEVLQYPDFTCVATFRRLVIGFGVVVPDTSLNEAYVSFLFVHPEWRRAGIAKFILYHLIQVSLLHKKNGWITY